MRIIDAGGLSEDEIRKVQDIVDLIRKKQDMPQSQTCYMHNETAGKISIKDKQTQFGSFSLGVKGNITRKEIYDYI